MEVTAVETIELHEMDIEETMWATTPETDDPEADSRYWARQLLFVRLHTDEGHVGLGEAYYKPSVDADVIHDHYASLLLGRDPRKVEKRWRELHRDAGSPPNGGAEMRALSAVDIALWDLKGQAAGVPIYELLGGKYNDALRTYNTCYEGEYSFLDEPVELAASLLEEGITAMKIWPYDDLANETDGQYVSLDAVEEGAEPLRLIREEFGAEMDVAMELHGRWNVQAAKRIVNHLEQYDPLWVEELIEVGDLGTYRELADATSLPVIVSEKLATKHAFNHLFRETDVDIGMFDLEWVGGITEGKKVAAMAEAGHRPVAPHNCGGPVLHFANLHLGAAIPNLMIMESVRGRYNGWHRELVTEPAEARDGELVVPDRPGLGTSLADDLIEAESVVRRETTA